MRRRLVDISVSVATSLVVGKRRVEFYETHFASNHAVFSPAARVRENNTAGTHHAASCNSAPSYWICLPFLGRNILPDLIKTPL
jgi:hypothetical protein